jgi:hypothetical protein
MDLINKITYLGQLADGIISSENCLSLFNELQLDLVELFNLRDENEALKAEIERLQKIIDGDKT